MHLESSIVVSQTTEQVWACLNDPYFLPKWDRSVATIVPTSTNAQTAVGFTFDTIAPKKKGQKEALRMSYRITEFTPGYQAKIALEKSNMFKTAVWTMRVEAAESGARITCLVDLTFRFKYFLLAPVLFFNKKAILTDLEYLKKAIEKEHGGAS